MTLLPLRRILCPTDFSDRSLKAVRTGVELARHFGARLDLLYAVPPVPASQALLSSDDSSLVPSFDVKGYSEHLKQSHETSLEEIIDREIPGSLETGRTVVFGRAAEQVVGFARENDIDLVVIATHGRSGLRRALLGSVAEQVCRLAECPVLTVRSFGREDE
ncbi:universal stress protein [candidate division WOR-3 bacterium]|nr:universal stress protein [candidate division WOR-3 bacterium]